MFSYAIVDLQVAYTENIDRVIGTVREVGASMERDPAVGRVLLAPLEVLGIESLEGGAATLRVRFKVLPLNQGKVANELRKRLSSARWSRAVSSLTPANEARSVQSVRYFSSSDRRDAERALPAVPDDLVVAAPSLALFETRTA